MEKLYTNDLNSHLYPEMPDLNENKEEKPSSSTPPNFDLKSLMPLLQGGGSLDPSNLMKMFGKNLSPQMSQMMALMNAPNMGMGQSNKKKPKTPAPDFISVEDYYSNN